jgi:hypothetical protein
LVPLGAALDDAAGCSPEDGKAAVKSRLSYSCRLR